jgi:hypothetical protein
LTRRWPRCGPGRKKAIAERRSERRVKGALSPGDYLAIAVSAADSKARLYKRESDGTLSTLATAGSALTLTSGTWYEAKVVLDNDPNDANLQQLRFWVDTLGGLIQVGRRIHEHIKAALELGELCSNDPVCAQHEPENTHECRFLHGAACHGCLLIAETSCEQHNEFLDRALVVPTVENLGIEFFLREQP